MNQANKTEIIKLMSKWVNYGLIILRVSSSLLLFLLNEIFHMISIYLFVFEVISQKDQEQYRIDDTRRPYQYVSLNQFADKFQQFYVGKNLLDELSTTYDKFASHKAAISFIKYSKRNFDLLKACFNLEWLLMKQNCLLFIFMFVQVTWMARILI